MIPWIEKIVVDGITGIGYVFAVLRMNGHRTKGNTMTTLDTQLTECVPQWTKLIAALIPEIADDYRATDDPDDNEPGMCVTIGFTPESEEKDASWNYQTGDNSYTGGAYVHAYWAVVYLSRESNPADVAADIADQLSELVLQSTP